MEDVTKLTKYGLMSEINGLNFLNEWTREDYAYRDKLEAEYYKRMEDEAINDTEGE